VWGVHWDIGIKNRVHDQSSISKIHMFYVQKLTRQ